MPMIQLSSGFLDKVLCPTGKAKVDYFDLSCRGLMVEVRPTGRKVFYFRYTDFRGVSGKSSWQTLMIYLLIKPERKSHPSEIRSH